MTRMRIAVAFGVWLALLLGMVPLAGLVAQGTITVPELRARLAARYDIVALQGGIALVPRQPSTGIRMIQVVDGAISVDGELLTGRQVSERLGDDATLVLQLSYLDMAAQRELAGASTRPSEASIQNDRRVSDGDRIRIGGDVSVARDEVVRGDAVAVMGSVNIDGEITGDAVAVMGSLNLGPNAVVQGDATAVGGRVNRAPGARIAGSVNDVGFGGRRNGPAMMRWGRFRSFWSPAASLAATVVRTMLLVLVGLLAMVIARTAVARIADRTASSPVRAGLVGLASELLFVPILLLTIVALAVSIVGIPLLLLVPLGVLLVGLVMTVGFSAMAFLTGRLLVRRLGWAEHQGYGAMAVGVVTILSVTILSRVVSLAGGGILGIPLTATGYLVEYTAWTLGLGGTLLVLLDTRAPRTPGSVPQAPASPPPVPQGT